MDSIAVRVSRSFDELRTVFESLKANCVLVYEHEADDEVSRTHVHALVQKADVTVLAFKRRIEKAVGKVNRSDWAFKETDENVPKYITYMSKGTLTPSYCRGGYNEQEIERFKSYWVNPINETKPTAVTYKDIVAEVIAEVPISELDFASESHVVVVTNILMKKLNQHRIVTGRFKIRDMLDTIFRMMTPQKFSACISKLFSERFI